MSIFVLITTVNDMTVKEIENKIGQLQYEISCLGLDEEDLTRVSIRTEELKNLVKKLTISDVNMQSEQLKTFDELFNYAWNLAQYSEEYAKLNEIRDRF